MNIAATTGPITNTPAAVRMMALTKAMIAPQEHGPVERCEHEQEGHRHQRHEQQKGAVLQEG